MDNFSESERWMKDARSCYSRSLRCFNDKDWQGAIQNFQLTIELAVKALIALFEEPDWTHNPQGQLLKIIETRKDEIGSRFEHPFIDKLLQTVEDVRISAPWHGWSIYGKASEDEGRWISASDLCTEDVARDLFKRAENAISTIEEFLKVYKM